VNCRGTVLGPFPDPELRDCVIDLDRGDAVVLYTDGVPEARGPTSAFGEGMLRSLIGWCRGSTAQEISDRIVNTVVDFQKGRPADDIAVLVLRVPG
jgi:serine phosphatase RsbU (regulator of sigma subunit)